MDLSSGMPQLFYQIQLYLFLQKPRSDNVQLYPMGSNQHTSNNPNSGLGRMFTRIDLRLEQTGSMAVSQLRSSVVILMESCVFNLMIIFSLLVPTTQLSKFGISTLENVFEL